MNVLAIGDIHGRTNWQGAPFDTADRVIFMGDFVDSKEYSDEQTTQIFQEIIALKRSDPDKFVLLLGNHDIQYMYYPNFPCSGFRPYLLRTWGSLYRDHESYFQVAYQLHDYLFTHAGVSNRWAQKHGLSVSAATLNEMQQTPGGREILFECGVLRGGQPGDTGGIVWADQRETYQDYLTHCHQIVGHTPQPFIRTLGDETSSITYIDVLGKTTEFWKKTF